MNLSRADITSAVKRLIAHGTGFDPKNVKVDMELEKDLGMDSLDRNELAMLIEDKFELEEIEQEELMKIKTVKEVVDIVQKYTLSI